jgi:23S rRNA (cytosine1962-C5)-methyltransferase
MIRPVEDRGGYELLDAGDGRRLERYGDHIVDRPAPAAIDPRQDPGVWAQADLRFHRTTGWEGLDGTQPWSVQLDGLTFELRPTETGQVGLFPEQAPNWRWLRRTVGAIAAAGSPPRVLNLFAFTGAATLSAAAAGAEVAHVDSSRPTVAWARRNADLSGLADRPIRWLVDDASAFAEREARRGRGYRGLILDPPSYGHAPGGRTWRLEKDLDDLLATCLRASYPAPEFVLLTAHTPGFGGERLAGSLSHALGISRGDVKSGELMLTARSGAHLPLGSFARWRGAAGAAGAR